MTKKYKIFSSISSLICLYSYGAALTLTHACNSETSTIFHLSKSRMGYLYVCLYLGFFFASLLTGAIADRRGKLPVISFGVAGMVIGLLSFVFTENYYIAMFSMALIGLGGGATETNVTGYIGDVWTGKRRNTMLNFSQTAFGFGAFCGPSLAAVSMNLSGNSHLAFYAVSVIGAVGFVMSLAVLRDRQETPKGGEYVPWKYILGDRYIIFMMLCLAFYCGIESGFSEWAGVYYKEIFSAGGEMCAFSVSVFWLGLTVGSFVLGILSKYMKRDKAVITACFGVLAGFFLWTSYIYSLSFIASFWIGFCLGPIFGTVLGLGTEKIPAHSGAVSSVLFGGAYLGGAFFPALIGINADIFGIKYSVFEIPLLTLCIILIFINFKKIRMGDTL
ncbi:MAG: MFS transporter [Armatimonadetes bacterium]|nr:MFS transporter [Candidatus Hippobium faecium]